MPAYETKVILKDVAFPTYEEAVKEAKKGATANYA